MGGLVSDLRSGLRVLRTSPASALAITGTLALGIGTTTALFSVVDGVLRKPLPVQDQARLLVVWTANPRGDQHWPVSYASYEGLRERLRTTSGVAAHPYAGTLPAVLHFDDGSAMPLERSAVTGQWFDVLGVRPRAGRLLTADDDHIGAPPVMVLSSALAERLFGGVSEAIGRRLRLDDATVTVVGVTPTDFEYPRAAAAWVPAAGFRDSADVAWDVVVRIAPGFTTGEAVADLTSALHRLPPETGPLGPIPADQVVETRAFTDEVVGDVRPALLMVGAGALLMAFVAGVNVVNLLLGRGIARQREWSIRTAIGATPGRLVRQLTVESIVLTSTATVLAVGIAFMVLKGLLALAPDDWPRLGNIGIDVRALAFTVVVAALAVVVCGVLPALFSTRLEPMSAFRASDVGAGRTRGRWLRQGLVVGQIAMAMMVLSAAGLLLRNLDRLQRLDVGFASRGLVLVAIGIPPARYAEPADLQRAMVQLAEHAATLPGVGHATAIVAPPFAGTQGVDATVFAEGQRLDDATPPLVNYEGADSAYFATLGLPILRGRAIDRQDRAGTQPIVAVNEAFARLFWPNQDPIGRRIKWGTSTSPSPWRTVIGLVADARFRDLTSVRPSVYVPYEQGIPVRPTYLAVRATSPTSMAAIRRAVAEQEPDATVVSMESLPALLARPLARPRFATALSSGFATLGILLSVVGTYGTLSFFVRQRRREIAIRIALGATPSAVRRLVLMHGLMMGILGITIGAVCVMAVARFLQPLLVEVSATDPGIMLGTALLMLSAVAAATLLPTRLATRTDPLVALRDE